MSENRACMNDLLCNKQLPYLLAVYFGDAGWYPLENVEPRRGRDSFGHRGKLEDLAKLPNPCQTSGWAGDAQLSAPS